MARLGVDSPPMNSAMPMRPSLPTTEISADAPSAITHRQGAARPAGSVPADVDDPGRVERRADDFSRRTATAVTPTLLFVFGDNPRSPSMMDSDVTQFRFPLYASTLRPPGSLAHRCGRTVRCAEALCPETYF